MRKDDRVKYGRVGDEDCSLGWFCMVDSLGGEGRMGAQRRIWIRVIWYWCLVIKEPQKGEIEEEKKGEERGGDCINTKYK